MSQSAQSERDFDDLMPAGAQTGAVGDDNDDDRDDERDDENEIPVRETDEATEAPEEFEVDDEDELGHPEDDDLDEIGDDPDELGDDPE
jgi:hypothetical protein